ncbi:helix-turn-helix domain-containing protein [Halococcoides cellulosivorans]|uniref:RNA polymerase subunit sigma-70 n=1 Tax=Halococcoides cellulosivorans TaxID=1679096 RepID=A0A2R4X3X9_9EURY|nr:RNA polymerase subunit sigma-70 [Halococcoides cellulosivorans]AWB28504.1 RNA polymerase subunit sigma-70 [Halococcoides cellulosivorans]
MYTACGEKELKILLAIKPGDTIVGVAQKIDENRETIRRTIDRLEAEGYVEYDDGLTVVDESVRDAGLQLLATSAGVSPPSISEAYVLPQFTGMDFAFTGIDAVYVWTRGGYQVAREPDDYPLFIAVKESNLEAWERFFERFDIPVSGERQPRDEIDGPLQVVVELRDSTDAESVDGRPVISMDETVEFAREHYATFQSALSMLDRMYDEVDSDADY